MKIGGYSSIEAKVGNEGSLIVVAMSEIFFGLGCHVLAFWIHSRIFGGLQGPILRGLRVLELHFGSLGSTFLVFWGAMGYILGASGVSRVPRVYLWPPSAALWGNR